jgi:hypothetical protein
MRKFCEVVEPQTGAGFGRKTEVLMLHPALSEDEDGHTLVDMPMIESMVEAYDRGDHSDVMMIAKVMWLTYFYGYECGVVDARDQYIANELLLMHTVGNA